MKYLEKLAAVGEAAYGKNWQSPLSRSMGVTDRTIRNFVVGSSVPNDLSSRLLAAMQLEMEKLNSAIDIINSDKMNGSDVTIDIITNIADQHSFNDEMTKQHAIDAMNNAVYEETYLSDLDAIAHRFANAKNK